MVPQYPVCFAFVFCLFGHGQIALWFTDDRADPHIAVSELNQLQRGSQHPLL